MNPYLALKRANRKPIKPPAARGTKNVTRLAWNALEHDPPKGKQLRGRDGTAFLLAAGRLAFLESGESEEQEKTPGWARRAALKEMRANGK